MINQKMIKNDVMENFEKYITSQMSTIKKVLEKEMQQTLKMQKEKEKQLVQKEK